MQRQLSLAIGLALYTMSCAPEPEVAADLVLVGGKVVTVDENVPDGQAIAVKGDTILAVGTDRQIRAYIGAQTEVIDLDGQLAIPGFIESHGHFSGVGNARMQLNLMEASNWTDIVGMVEAVVGDAAPGELIQGRGWHQEKFVPMPEVIVEGYPTHDELSAVSPDNPVVLRHASGHASFANAKAMEMAGIDRNTPDPRGGTIVRDEAGEAIGVFTERASGLLNAAAANAAPPDPRRQIELAVEEVLSKGITSFHDAGSNFGTVDLLKQMVDEGALGVRLWVMLGVGNRALEEKIDDYLIINYGDHRLTVRSIKRSIDGALGSRGAWMLEPYTDMPSTAGHNTGTVADIQETARIAFEHGFQLATHAIGDRANREVLDIYERAFAADPGKTDLRWRIEHAQHISPEDIPRFGQMGVIASMEGVHATSDAPYVFERLGPVRAEEGAYVWQSLLRSGAVVTNGTDAPVEDVDPIASYYATISRKVADGSVFFPEQRMSRLEALRSYTMSGAYAAFEEDIKGSLTPGKLADITVLSQDIMTVAEDAIPMTQVIYTIVGGKVMYTREGER